MFYLRNHSFRGAWNVWLKNNHDQRLWCWKENWRIWIESVWFNLLRSIPSPVSGDFAKQNVGIPTEASEPNRQCRRLCSAKSRHPDIYRRDTKIKSQLLRLFLFMSHCVYILYSEKFDRYYIGQTQDFNERLSRHNSGHVPSTKFVDDGFTSPLLSFLRHSP